MTNCEHIIVHGDRNVDERVVQPVQVGRRYCNHNHNSITSPRAYLLPMPPSPAPLLLVPLGGHKPRHERGDEALPPGLRRSLFLPMLRRGRGVTDRAGMTSSFSKFP